MTDIENNRIQILKNLNGHVLVWGQSGQGKTYFLCRQMEEAFEQGERIILFDYSGSYSDEELRKHRFQFRECVERLSLTEQMCVSIPMKSKTEFAKGVVEAFIETFKSTSYFQYSLLEGVIEEIVEKKLQIGFSEICNKLNEHLNMERVNEGVEGNVDNLGRLLMRFYPLERNNNYQLEFSEKMMYKGITILDFTNAPLKIRKILTDITVSLFWRSIVTNASMWKNTVLVFDELQHLSVDHDGTLSAILREGRKFAISVFMGTQFIKGYRNGELQTLLQAANYVIFKPTTEEVTCTAKIIDPQNSKKWEKIILQLDKGEAILKGEFCVNQRKKSQHGAIVIRM